MQTIIQEELRKSDSPSSVLCCGEENMNDWDTAQRLMASLYVSGYRVSWADITRHTACYSPIPLYGWDDKAYLLETTDFSSRRHGTVDTSYKGRAGHININMEFFGYLRDYSLQDEMVFPAAAYIEYFSEYDNSKLAAALKDITIHKNMKLLPLTSEGYLQTLKLDLKQDLSHLSAVTEDGEVMAEATLTKAREISIPQALEISSIKQRCSSIKDGSEVYSQFESEGLAYGYFFKLIKHIHIGDMEALAVCDAPNSNNRFERIETLLLDNAFQTAISAFTNGPSLYLPSTIGRLQMFVEKVSPTTAFIVHSNLKEWNQRFMVADIVIADKDGNIWLTMDSFRADSTAEFSTDVDYDSCCYTTQYQSINANMDVASIKIVAVNNDPASRNL